MQRVGSLRSPPSPPPPIGVPPYPLFAPLPAFASMTGHGSPSDVRLEKKKIPEKIFVFFQVGYVLEKKKFRKN